MNPKQASKVLFPKIVILGSSGFIGSALLERFNALGHSIAGFNSSTLDLTSEDSSRQLSSQLDQETVLIVASRARRAVQDKLASFHKDIAMLTHAAQALESRRIKKCLYFSSSSIYADTATNWNVTEETPAAPASLYGVARFAGEGLLALAAARQQTPLVIFRPCMVYGPGDTGQAYGPSQFIHSIKTENQVRLFGDGSESRDYIFIDDVAEAAVRFALGNQQGIYNVACGQNHSFQQIISLLGGIAEKKFDVVQTARLKPQADQKIACGKFLQEMPDYRFTPFAEGLERTYSSVHSPHCAPTAVK